MIKLVGGVNIRDILIMSGVAFIIILQYPEKIASKEFYDAKLVQSYSIYSI